MNVIKDLYKVIEERKKNPQEGKKLGETEFLMKYSVSRNMKSFALMKYPSDMKYAKASAGRYAH